MSLGTRPRKTKVQVVGRQGEPREPGELLLRSFAPTFRDNIVGLANRRGRQDHRAHVHHGRTLCAGQRRLAHVSPSVRVTPSHEAQQDDVVGGNNAVVGGGIGLRHSE